MFWKKTSFERKHLSQPFDNKSWYQKKIKLNLILTNPELFIIYWTCHHLFWFCFLKLLLILYCQSSWREISILKKQFLIMSGVPKSNCKIKIRFFLSFIPILNLRKLKKKKQINISLLNWVSNFCYQRKRKLYICQFH